MPDRPNSLPHIIVLYNENPAWPQADKDWSDQMLALMWQGLREIGASFSPLSFFDDLSGLDAFDPAASLVFNWGEELAGQPWSEAAVAVELERRGFTYTGASPEVFRRTQNRQVTKEQLRAAGVPTLPYAVVTSAAETATWAAYPAIAKGLNQHASYGIGPESVVSGPAELARQVAYLRETFADDTLVEPFLDTREFHVAVWGNHPPEALPPVEHDYSVFAEMNERLYTYQWKFDRTSRGFNEIQMHCPAAADEPELQARVIAAAVGAYQALGLRDYGRIDLRLLDGVPQVLDVNPNPGIDPMDVLPHSAAQLGLTFGQMIGRILSFAAERLPASTPTRPEV